MSEERTFKARVDHPDMVAIIRNCANVESCMDGMTDGDKLQVLSVIGNRLSRDMYENCVRAVQKRDGLSMAQKLNVFMTVMKIQAASSDLRSGVQTLDLIANPQRYQLTSEEGVDKPLEP